MKLTYTWPSSRARRRGILLALAGLAMGMGSACSAGNEPMTGAVDAAPRVCWSGGGTPTADAEVEIGTALPLFAPIAEEGDVPLFYGPQGGAHFYLIARMRGMFSGDPENVLALNPTTFFSVYTESGEAIQSAPCAFPMGYRSDDSDFYVLSSRQVVILKNQFIRQIPGNRVRLRVEIMDPQGGYAVDERWVRVVTEEVDAGVPVDAGAADAPAADAGLPDGA